MAGLLDFLTPARPDVDESQDTDSVLRRQNAAALASVAAAGPVTPREPRQAATVALRLPERPPGQRVSVAVDCAIDQLHRALTAHARGMTTAQRKRLEAVLVDLENVLSPDPEE